MAAITLLRCQQKSIGEQYTKIITNGLAVANIMMVIAISGLSVLFCSILPTYPMSYVDYAQNVAMVRIFLMMSTVLTVAIATIRGSKSSAIPVVSLLLLIFSEFAGRAFFYDIHMAAGAGM